MINQIHRYIVLRHPNVFINDAIIIINKDYFILFV